MSARHHLLAIGFVFGCSLCLLQGQPASLMAQTKDAQQKVKQRLEVEKLKAENEKLKKRIKELEKEVQAQKKLAKENFERARHALYLSQLRLAANAFQSNQLKARKLLEGQRSTTPEKDKGEEKKRKSNRRKQRRNRLDKLEANQKLILEKLQQLQETLERQGKAKGPEEEQKNVEESKKDSVLDPTRPKGEKVQGRRSNPPKVKLTGKVTKVLGGTATTRYAQINLGSDDSLVKGHTLYVYRTDKTGTQRRYIGELEITDTRAHIVAGKMIPRSNRRSPLVLIGDVVSSNFNP